MPSPTWHRLRIPPATPSLLAAALLAASALPLPAVAAPRPLTLSLPTTPATTPNPQTPPQATTHSPAPLHPDLVLAAEPLVRIGTIDGPDAEIFGNVTGAVRLEDGSVVVADEHAYEIRLFDANGRHLWTSGRAGEGPGEYGGVRLMRGCPGSPITVFDWHRDRITELDADGSVTGTRNLAEDGINPYGEPACSPDGALVYTPWWNTRMDYLTLSPGDTYRVPMELVRAKDGVLDTLGAGIPGVERFVTGPRGGRPTGSGPAEWGKDLRYAVTASGVWYGSADDYELTLLEAAGGGSRAVRWDGPDLEVTGEHLDRYRDAYAARYDDPAERRRFLRQQWPDIEDRMPERFPAYESLLSVADGSVWVVTFNWRSPERELHLLGADGTWLRRATVPARATVLDAGPDWLLLLERDELDMQRVAVYELVEVMDPAGR